MSAPVILTKPLTRRDLAAAVDDLFTSGSGHKVDRLVLWDDKALNPDFGGWSRDGMVNRLCKLLGVKE